MSISRRRESRFRGLTMTDNPFVLRCDTVGVTTLTLNRPEARNTLSLGMLKALSTELHHAATDSSVRVVVLAGARPAFCAGHDLKEIRTENFGVAYAETLFAECTKVMLAIVSLPKPVIAQVHGVATAAGCQLVASCDLAVAADDARFATPGVNIGLFCSTPMVPVSRAVGRKRAMQLLLTGEPIDALTALEWGLVNHVVPLEELEPAVAELVEAIARSSSYT